MIVAKSWLSIDIGSLRWTSIYFIGLCIAAGGQPGWTQIAEQRASDSLKTPDSFPRFPAVEPADVSRTFRIQNGFQMQLIASEPLVTDPVAMAIDEDGRAFVAEMNDYPYTDARRHVAWQDNTTDAPIGRIRMLEDTDSDGIYDKSRIFADQLSWPSGILCYRGGVFVTATPDIWYLKDSDADGVADIREKVFTGFRKYNVQAVMNNPIWSLDNHIYVAGSSNGGNILPGIMAKADSARTSAAKPIVARGDFRIDPRTQSLELQAGGARFGNCFDDWGNRFLCNIRNPAIHVVLDNRYLTRNPAFAPPTAIFNIADSGDQMPIYRISPLEPWRELRGKQWSADPTKKVPRSELTGGGVFTSTSGITVYRSQAFASQYRGQMFLGEVANNVIYRQAVVPVGNTFWATRADEACEFVASTDTWFRPVNLYNAPDGTLYVLDMYREFIEHPWSIPDDIHARLDLTSGRDRGRIYRLAPTGFRTSQLPKLSRATVAELVAQLSNPSSWWRETAQRLLVEAGDRKAVPLLRLTLEGSDPLATVHALWTLAGLESLSDEDLEFALSNSSARVLEHAVRIAESRIADNIVLRQKTIGLADTNDSRLRLQVALSLGGVRDPGALAALVRLASIDAGDEWMRAALCCALPENTLALTEALLRDEIFLQKQDGFDLLRQLADIAAASGNPQAIQRVIDASRSSELGESNAVETRHAIWFGLASGARRKGTNLYELFKADLSKRPASDGIEVATDEVQAANSSASEISRVSATIRLTRAPLKDAAPSLVRLIDPFHPHEVQIAAVRGLAGYRETAVSEWLISRLRHVTPVVREELFAALLERPERTMALLKAVEKGDLSAPQLGLLRKTQLLASKNNNIRELAERVLTKVESSRSSVIERYLPYLTNEGNAASGRDIFVKQCAACHRADGVGVEIGPHMETVRVWDRQKLLVNILDPNREVAPQSTNYAIVLSDGKVLSGLIADETANSLTLRRAGVAPETIARDDIEQLSNTGLSMMPIGLEESVSPADMIDLLAFLQSTGKSSDSPAIQK